MNKRQLEAMSTKQLVALLCRINDVLWRRFKPQEEYEYEGARNAHQRMRGTGR